MKGVKRICLVCSRALRSGEKGFRVTSSLGGNVGLLRFWLCWRHGTEIEAALKTMQGASA